MNLGKTKCSIDHEVLTALAYLVILALTSLVRTIGFSFVEEVYKKKMLLSTVL